MATITKTICDKCKDEIKGKHDPIHLRIGESRDPVDGRSSADYESLDLCPSCLRLIFVKHVITNLSLDDSIRIIAHVRAVVKGK